MKDDIKRRQYSYYAPTRNFTLHANEEELLKRHDDGTFSNVGYR